MKKMTWIFTVFCCLFLLIGCGKPAQPSVSLTGHYLLRGTTPVFIDSKTGIEYTVVKDKHNIASKVYARYGVPGKPAVMEVVAWIGQQQKKDKLVHTLKITSVAAIDGDQLYQ